MLTITDDTSTSAVMYPTWVTANTGNLPTYTTSTKLSFNPSTGVLSSTSFLSSTAAGLTADAGSAQGNGVITSTYNIYSTVATTGDAATLPATFAVGTIIYIKNDGANSMDVFPASGDDAGAGADTAVAIAAGVGAAFIGTTADAVWTQLY